MEYLVQYGLGAFLGRFQATAALARGERVVLQTPRGLELGTVLESSPASAGTLGPLGHVVRPATPADEADTQRRQQQAHALLAEAQALADTQALPLTFLDAEILLDGHTAILQAIHYDTCDADPLFAQLSERHGLHVQLHDLTSVPEPHADHGCATCGKTEGGCSSGSCGTGGGCSSGSCSSGKVKSAEEMTAYFAALRQQMEATNARVPLH